MKAYLVFNLPEEQFDFRMANEGSRWRNALWDISEELRGKIKYGQIKNQELKLYEEMRDLIRNTMSDHRIDFDE